MTNKELILSRLLDAEGDFVSGGELAEGLSISRTAIWKGVESLRRDGYPIEAAAGKGYCLQAGTDILSEEGILRYLKTQGVRLRIEKCVPSTNTMLKDMAERGEPELLCIASGKQTAGRGRIGRSFYSPADSGLYFSILLRPNERAEDASRLTACAAVSVCEAIEALAPVQPKIKWVNDVLVNGQKVCGILTEASIDFESGHVSYMVVGIGINIRTPAEGYPDELRGIAGAAFDSMSIPDLRNRLLAGTLDRLLYWYRCPEDRDWICRYRERSAVLGKKILILAPGKNPEAAFALGLDDACGLIVRTDAGEQKTLTAGEVSIRPEPCS